MSHYQFHPEAEDEFKKSVRWHEENRKKSGKQFAENVIVRLDEIVENPEARSADSDGIRWATVKKFPYHIYYIIKTLIVWILAIWHNKRKPDEWRERAKDV